MPYTVVKALMRPDFKTISQSSFDRCGETEGVSVLVPMGNGQMGIRYSNSKLLPQTEPASQALDALKKALDGNVDADKVVLQPGDVLVMNNRTSVHRREAIRAQARFDGSDRWLIRVYGFSHQGWLQTKRLNNQHHVIVVDHN